MDDWTGVPFFKGLGVHNSENRVICLGNNSYFEHTKCPISKTKEIIATKQKAHEIIMLTAYARNGTITERHKDAH